MRIRSAAPARLVLAGFFQAINYIGSLTGLLGVSTLFLASTGLYGVLSQLVAGRTREIGVRLALGASRRQVTTLILVDGLKPTAIGLAIGFGLGTVGRMLLRITLPLSVAIVDLWAVVLITGALLVLRRTRFSWTRI